MRPILLTYNVVPSRCWCPLCHVITFDRHCLFHSQHPTKQLNLNHWSQGGTRSRLQKWGVCTN